MGHRHPADAALGVEGVDRAEVGQPGHGQPHQRREGRLVVERRGQQRGHLGQEARALMQRVVRLVRERDVDHDHADAEHGAAGAPDRRAVADVVGHLLAGVRHGPLHALERPSGGDDVAQERLGAGGALAEELGGPAPEVRLDRQALDGRQGLVDADVTQVGVEEREAHGRGGEESLHDVEGEPHLVAVLLHGLGKIPPARAAR